MGGGIDSGETEEQCIVRECIEEVGYKVEIRERVCSAETYYEHHTIGFFHPIQVYYSGKLVEKVKEPVEQDHVLRWVRYENIKGKMYLEMQSWTVEQVMKE